VGNKSSIFMKCPPSSTSSREESLPNTCVVQLGLCWITWLGEEAAICCLWQFRPL